MTGLSWHWPWLFLLLPLPLLVRRLLPVAVPGVRGGALLVPFFRELERLARSAGGVDPSGDRSPLPVWIAAVVWILLVTAAARPEWVDPPQEFPASGRDLFLVVDLSGSMEIPDFILHDQRVERLTALQEVVGKFIERRRGDRLGLILFGSNAYLQTPLTFDTESVAYHLRGAEIGLAGKATAIGDALVLALKRLKDRPGQSRVVLLFSDGGNTAGAVDPRQAAHLAAEEGIRIHTVGIGSDQPLAVPTPFGQVMRLPAADLDEKLLTEMATTTGGRYFRATDTAALEEIHEVLDRLEPTLAETGNFLRREELYPWPLA
ncbi:MAG: VWA domain-containing protein, partial [Magnetococcales bacterium]|nr:VWA domain-containing protein [Magnetococcales bacterium]